MNGCKLTQWHKVGRKEGYTLFSNALNTFYFWLYGITYTVKDHSDTERGNLLSPLYSYSFQIAASNLLYVLCHKQVSTYYYLGYTNSGALAGMKNISMEPATDADVLRQISRSPSLFGRFVANTQPNYWQRYTSLHYRWCDTRHCISEIMDHENQYSRYLCLHLVKLCIHTKTAFEKERKWCKISYINTRWMFGMSY